MPKAPAATDSPIDFGVLLNLAFGAFKTQLHDALAQAGFDDIGSSFGYVFRLLAPQPVNLRDVAQALAISAPGALKIVNDMVDKGYVERLEHPLDARQKLLGLTPRARRAMAAAHRFHGVFERGLVERLGARQAAAVRAALETIVSEAEARAPAGAVALRPL